MTKVMAFAKLSTPAGKYFFNIPKMWYKMIAVP